MNMIVKEVKENLQRKKALTLFIMLGVMMFLITATILVQSYMNIQHKDATVSSFKGLNVYKLSDTLTEDRDFQAYLNEPDALDRIKQLYNYLEEELNDRFIYVFDQSIAIPTESGEIEKKFLVGYEDGSPNPVFKEEDGKLYGTVKAVQINKQALDMFPLSLSEGTTFSSGDFYHKNKDGIIPILLGSDYADVYEVGDTFNGRHLFKEFQFEIKGFLHADSFVVKPQYAEIYLSRYVVMPSQQFENPVNDEDLSFQQKHYFQMINGAIFSPDKRDVIEKQLEQAKKAANFPYHAMLGDSTTVLGHLFDAIEENFNWLLFLSIILLVGCVISISILMLKRIHDNHKNMMIHLISGGTMRQMFRYIFTEVVVLVGIPGAFIILLFIFIFRMIVPLHILIISASVVFIILLTIIPIYLQFRRLPISRLLKREE